MSDGKRRGGYRKMAMQLITQINQYLLETELDINKLKSTLKNMKKYKHEIDVSDKNNSRKLR